MKVTCVECKETIEVEITPDIELQIQALEAIHGPVREVAGFCGPCQRFHYLGRKVTDLLELILSRNTFRGMREKDFGIVLKTTARMIELDREAINAENLEQELRFQIVEAER